MSKYTIKDWLNGRVWVKISREEEFDRLMDIAEENGVKWFSGAKAKERLWGFKRAISIAIRRGSSGMTGMVWNYCEDDVEFVTLVDILPCYPEDKYDFLTGEPEALDRMQVKEPISLEDVPTEKLVEELSKREGVRTVNPGGRVMFLGIKKEVVK